MIRIGFIVQLMLFGQQILDRGILGGVIQRHVFMESTVNTLNDFLSLKKLHAAPPQQRHQIVIAVKQKNIDHLTNILHDISNPDSINYGKHWTKAEVVQLTENQEGRNVIVEDLEKNGIMVEDETLHGEYIIASGTVERLESYLNCKFHVFDIPDLGSEEDKVNHDHVVTMEKKRGGGGGSAGGRRRKQVIRTEAYSVPAEIHEHVTTILNTVQIAPWWKNKVVESVEAINDDEKRGGEREITKKRSIRGAAVGTLNPTPQPTLAPSRAPYVSGEVSPPFLKNYYNISVSNISPSEALVSHGVLELGTDYLNPDDLTTFQKRYNLPTQALAGYNDHVSSLACTFYPDCAESNLDVQYIMGVAPGIPTYYHYESSTKINDAFTNFVVEASNMTNPANVYSISWVGYELATTASTRQVFNTEAIKLGVMGTTLIAASGDDGVANYQIASYGRSRCGYYPAFPSTSPYVTSIGGTMGPENGEEEISCMANPQKSIGITTGGGFSNNYPIPDFQKDHIADYFQTVMGTDKRPSQTKVPYSSSGRGYPDVSLLAHRYLIIMAGTARYVDGTSASAPVFGAMVSLVNQRRKAAGKSLMGWINPFLYQYSSHFTNDITVGKNNCGRSNALSMYEIVGIVFAVLIGVILISVFHSWIFSRMSKTFFYTPAATNIMNTTIVVDLEGEKSTQVIGPAVRVIAI
eukprot:gene4350-4663_t